MAKLAWLMAGVVAVVVTANGCVTETVNQSSETDFGTARPSDENRKPPSDNDPMPVIATVYQFVSGDTLILAGGRTVKLAGIRAPKAGENCSNTARVALQKIIGRQLIRLTYVTGTKYTDPVWHANVLFPNPKAEELPSGTIVPRGQGANSANVWMLGEGLARPDGIDKLAFSRVIEDGERKGKLQELTERQNEAIRAQFRDAVKNAQKNELYIYSRSSHP